ncbi:hypothetical protein BU17DRAFT_79151 [Hysterangium stoloniferum]|nr:hypothetical protein BU17DRAFT_79151 [Hysterangium stoloniferum]
MASTNYQRSHGHLPTASAVLKALAGGTTVSPIPGLAVIFITANRIVDMIIQKKSNTEEANRLGSKVAKLALFFKEFSESSACTTGAAGDDLDTDIAGCIRILKETEKSLQRIEGAKTFKRFINSYDNRTTLQKLSDILDQELDILCIKKAFKLGTVVDHIDAKLDLIFEERYKKSDVCEFQSSRKNEKRVGRKQASNSDLSYKTSVTDSATNVDDLSSDSGLGFSTRSSNLKSPLVNDSPQGTPPLFDETNRNMPHPIPVPQYPTTLIDLQHAHFKTASSLSPIQFNINSPWSVQNQHNPQLHTHIPRNDVLPVCVIERRTRKQSTAHIGRTPHSRHLPCLIEGRRKPDQVPYGSSANKGGHRRKHGHDNGHISPLAMNL